MFHFHHSPITHVLNSLSRHESPITHVLNGWSRFIGGPRKAHKFECTEKWKGLKNIFFRLSKRFMTQPNRNYGDTHGFGAGVIRVFVCDCLFVCCCLFFFIFNPLWQNSDLVSFLIFELSLICTLDENIKGSLKDSYVPLLVPLLAFYRLEKFNRQGNYHANKKKDAPLYL